ncbi:DUF397 domain-containing protein [Streptomyces sp. NPDC060275]|uniref:DUF397 domain-containing protein n=1 Tax=Streptomyces sp. NPDC060275 TaxID=3347090 RepID=UPI003662FAB1
MTPHRSATAATITSPRPPSPSGSSAAGTGSSGHPSATSTRTPPGRSRTHTRPRRPGGDCVEVADNRATGAVPVRDSKNPSGPVVTVGAGAWQSFVDGLR